MRPVDIVRKIAPHARPAYLEAFENGDALFAAAGITTPQRLAHFLAQTAHETGGYTITTENGNYTASRIAQVWPSRPSAVAFAHDPEALFNHVYANRMGNGPPSSGDGWKYRGGGIMQTTGREAYRKFGRRIGVDLEGHPELVYSAEHALKPALAEWTDTHCNALADANDIATITRRINGGLTGYGERRHWYSRIRPLIDHVDLKGGNVPIKPQPDPAPVKPAPRTPWWAALLNLFKRR